MNKKPITIAVGLSGGVDSAATAFLLKEKGYRVIGLTLKLIDDFDESDAVLVAEKLGIDHHVLYWQDDFKEKVIHEFVSEYVKGNTPNPCIMCNEKMKYGMMMDKALELGADYLALGHYANIETVNENGVDSRFLCKGKSIRKDQSYNLYVLRKEKLDKIIFPLGDYEEKQKVRNIISELIPEISKKKDSSDICFIPDKNHGKFIELYTNKKYEGNFVDKDGQVLGKHTGIFKYTIGQKRKLEVKFDPPKFVISINSENNDIILGDDEDTYANGIYASKVNYIMDEYRDKENFTAIVKLCQWGYEIEANLININEELVKVEFKEAQRAPAPGQAVVFYQGDRVIGGGVIEKKIIRRDSIY